MKGGKQNSDAVAGDNGVSSEQPSTGASQAEQQERDGDAGEEDEDVGKEYEEKLEEEELADVEKPKLAEGFYEIEDVWRKRVRKGKVQYLIKWRGWPESANTWEPVENLMTCYDVIDAFEESLRSGKQRLARKRKRQHGVTHTQIKKQQQQQQCSPAAATNDVPAVKVSIMEEPMPSSPLASLDAINHVDSSGSGLNDIQVDGVANDNDLNFDSSIKEINEKNELDLKLSELKGGIATKETSVDRSGDGLTSGFSAANGTESLQSGRCTGAKRRKPASVRRFKPETASGVMNDSQDALPNATSGPFVAFTKEGIHDHGFVGNALGCKNKWDDSKDACAITEIIKPMSYSASVSSDFQDVSVTFLAKRSDGKEVMVDNKFLKMNNPLVLINFYEQNLRYHPTQ
ncbi:chromo domain protein LHP1-like [Nicotiana sylvestris]|uniref:Chromo domain protein LHP1-like n=1 Tax=Nicotiana sylvestris TaxID=4096 RepID=A0A1U7WDN7_NICSY|nr:PREDICTED: chromo domain protein LHP1-like [Nicotiana sylvestris]